jgi:hypothetical protein
MASSDDDPTRPDRESLGQYIPADDTDPDPPDESERWSPGSFGSINIGNPPKVTLGLIRILLRLLLALFGVIRVAVQTITGVLRRILVIVERRLNEDDPRDDSLPSDSDRPDPPVG